MPTPQNPIVHRNYWGGSILRWENICFQKAKNRRLFCVRKAKRNGTQNKKEKRAMPERSHGITRRKRRRHDSIFPLFWKRFRVQNPESRIQNQNPESRIQNPESRIQNPESRIQNPESRIQNPESRIQNPE